MGTEESTTDWYFIPFWDVAEQVIAEGVDGGDLFVADGVDGGQFFGPFQGKNTVVDVHFAQRSFLLGVVPTC